MASFSVHDLPGLNALLNAASTVLLLAGYTFIRRRRILLHKICMLSAVVCSAAFLVSYIAFHVRVGVVHFTAQGWIRPVYFTILTTHTILAITIVPLVIVTLTFAFLGRFARHKAIAHWTLPLWLYVSITGVIIYWLLFRLYAPATSSIVPDASALFSALRV
jgi:putative membrane protein